MFLGSEGQTADPLLQPGILTTAAAAVIVNSVNI